MLRSDEWSGWRFGEPVSLLWGNLEHCQRRGWRGWLRTNVLERVSGLDTLKMDEVAMDRFAQRLLAKPPAMLLGHAHSVYLFAEYWRKAGHPKLHPHGIITTAMVLHTWQRRVIGEVFGCPATNRYGCEEASLIACECNRHDGLHVNADGVYDSLERLRQLVHERFGSDVAYECEFVDRIPQEPSGKYRFCISKVQNPFTRTQEVAVA
jgi:phenylacetate-CoA ligase